MQEKHLFEYAIIRVVPCVEREEFINAGVILYCAAEKFLQTAFGLSEIKLSCLSAEIDLAEVQQRLQAFAQVAAGEKNAGPIATLPLASRFRWLTATRSTIIQVSPVHPGLCRSAQETLQRLFEQLVQ